jgi:hypothetical protein
MELERSGRGRWQRPARATQGAAPGRRRTLTTPCEFGLLQSEAKPAIGRSFAVEKRRQASVFPSNHRPNNLEKIARVNDSSSTNPVKMVNVKGDDYILHIKKIGSNLGLLPSSNPRSPALESVSWLISYVLISARATDLDHLNPFRTHRLLLAGP